MEFEWDEDKAKGNLKKHKIAFTEAATVFGDPLSSTFPDPDHSTDEDRYITIGTSESGRVLIVSHSDRHGRVRIISVRKATRRSEKHMKKKRDSSDEDDLRPEYDASLIRKGVRGKYSEAYKNGTNLVLLAPDVAAAFPNAKAVNEALRLLMHVAEQTAARPH